MPLAAAPVLAAGAGLTGDVFSAIMGASNSRRQNKRMVDFWRMNNEYNHPSAQMARLQEAGLNPNLIYGSGVSGATGQSSPIGTPDKPDTPQFRNPIAEYQNANQRRLQSDNLRAQNTVLLNDAAKKVAETAKTVMDTDIKGINKSVMARTMEDQILKIQSDANSSFNKAELTFQNLNRQRLSESEQSILRKENFKSLLETYATGSQNLSNAEKLGRLRDLEIELKQKNVEFFTANAVVNLLSKFLGIPQFR